MEVRSKDMILSIVVIIGLAISFYFIFGSKKPNYESIDKIPANKRAEILPKALQINPKYPQ